MSNAAMTRNTRKQHTETLDHLTVLIEQARQLTARARRGRHVRLMRSARRIGEQLDAQGRQLSTIYDDELLASASALITVSHGYLEAITEQLDAIERERHATTTERIHAVRVISQRRALENLHTR